MFWGVTIFMKVAAEVVVAPVAAEVGGVINVVVFQDRYRLTEIS
jgi:hypothetical protein